MFFVSVETHFPSIEHSSVYLDGGTRTSRVTGVGHRRAAATINFLRLLPSAGTFSGWVRVYGIKKS